MLDKFSSYADDEFVIALRGRSAVNMEAQKSQRAQNHEEERREETTQGLMRVWNIIRNNEHFSIWRVGGLKFSTFVHFQRSGAIIVSHLKCDIQQKEGSKKSDYPTYDHVHSQCSRKGGNLRELTRWREPTGKPPIGTFLYLYDLLHTYIG